MQNLIFSTKNIDDFIIELATELATRLQPNNQPQQLKEILTPDEAAKFLNIAKPTIYSRVSRGELPHYKRSGRLYFDRSKLEAYIRQGNVNTIAELADQAHEFFGKKKGGSNAE
jgi:excisionase family DNA binding protein